MRLSDEQLCQHLQAGESWHVEFKESLQGNTRTAICEAICAFANDLSGSGQVGVIFIGIKDDGKPSGFVANDENLSALAGYKTDGRILPPPAMLVEKRELKDMKLAVISVLPSISPPVKFNGRIHVRNGPRKSVATAEEERILNEKRLSGNHPFDIRPLPDCNISMLNISHFKEGYLLMAFHPDILAENNRTDIQQLAATKMITAAKEPSATVLGCLVLGKTPRDFIPGFYVQFLRIDGTGLADPIIDEANIDGTLAEVLHQVDGKLKTHIRNVVDVTSHDREQRDSDYPVAVLQQIVRNAIMHRNYEGTNAPVRITWFNDRIEVQNPGGPFGQVTTENFGQPGITDYRNPNLAEAMKVLGYVQRFGVGISISQQLLKEAGHPSLQFSPNQNHVLVTIRGR